MLAITISGPVGIRTRVRSSGGPYAIQAILRAQMRIERVFAGARYSPAILCLLLRGRRRMKNFLSQSFFVNSVYPQHPQETRSLWMARNVPGPHLGQNCLVLVTVLPSTWYALDFFTAALGAFAFAILITPLLRVPRAPWPRCRSS